MHISIFTTLFAATAVLGAPTESTPIASLANEVFDQGDGFYVASYNGTGVFDVQFTPTAAELNARGPIEQLASRDTHSLSKRRTECSGRNTGNLATLDEANRELARNGGAQGNYGAKIWGWVHRDAETSYFCPYSSIFLTYNMIIEMHTEVTKKCGQAGYGYDQRFSQGGAPNDISVGRTWRGDRFCDDRFHG